MRLKDQAAVKQSEFVDALAPFIKLVGPWHLATYDPIKCNPPVALRQACGDKKTTDKIVTGKNEVVVWAEKTIVGDLKARKDGRFTVPRTLTSMLLQQRLILCPWAQWFASQPTVQQRWPRQAKTPPSLARFAVTCFLHSDGGDSQTGPCRPRPYSSAELCCLISAWCVAQPLASLT